MWEPFRLLEVNTMVSFETWLLLIVIVGSLIFMAKSFQLALVMLQVLTASLFIWFYEAGYNYVPSLTVFLAVFAVMCLSLFAASVNQPITRGVS